MDCRAETFALEWTTFMSKRFAWKTSNCRVPRRYGRKKARGGSKFPDVMTEENARDVGFVIPNQGIRCLRRRFMTTMVSFRRRHFIVRMAIVGKFAVKTFFFSMPREIRSRKVRRTSTTRRIVPYLERRQVGRQRNTARGLTLLSERCFLD